MLTDSVFGSVVAILKDSLTGRVHVPGFEMSESLKRGSIVVLIPSLKHGVTFSNRDSPRFVINFNF